jgi:hypothetical protein
MPNLPISQLPELTAMTANAEFAVAQDGVTYKVKNSTLAPFPTVFGLFAQTADSFPVSGTTVETTLINGGVGTLSVGENQFQIGDSFRGDFGGVFNVANNQTLRIRVRAGSTVLLDSGPQLVSQIVNDVWNLLLMFTVRKVGVAGVAEIVSIGRFNYSKTSNGDVQGFAFNTVNNTTFDTTVLNTLEVTAQWGSTNVGNSIYTDIFVLDKIY